MLYPLQLYICSPTTVSIVFLFLLYHYFDTCFGNVNVCFLMPYAVYNTRVADVLVSLAQPGNILSQIERHINEWPMCLLVSLARSGNVGTYRSHDWK